MLWFDFSGNIQLVLKCEPRIFAGGVQSLDVDLVLDVLDHVDVEHVDVLAGVLSAVLGGGESDLAVSVCDGVRFITVEMTVGGRQVVLAVRFSLGDVY